MSIVKSTSQIPGLRWASDEDVLTKLHENGKRNVRQAAIYFQVSREAVYQRLRSIEKKSGAVPPQNTPQNVNPATAQGYEVTTEAYRTTAHQGGVV